MQIEIFISYSHQDEEEKNELLRHLSVLRRQDLFDLWSDDRIGVGESWKNEIEEALTRARVAILLVTKNFLTSDFILEQEIPELLKRHQQGLTIIPVIAKDCAWRSVGWLAELQVFNDGFPVWRDGGKHVDKELTELTYLVAGIADEAKIQIRAGPVPLEESAGEVTAPSANRIVGSLQASSVISPSEARQAAPPIHTHILFISTASFEERGSKGWLSFFWREKQTAELLSASSQLYTAVNAAALAQQREIAGQLSCQPREEGVIVTTSGAAATLLCFAIHLLRTTKAVSGAPLRMGLHSGEMEQPTLNRRTQLPNDAVYTARRVMELGRGGHLLASSQAADLLRKDAAFTSMFHSVGSRAIEPPDSIELYNIYKRGFPADANSDFGNDGRPLSEVPDTVVKKFRAPRRLRALKEQRAHLTFWPGRSHVKVKLEIKDGEGNKARGVLINCHKHGESGCSFEYRLNDATDKHKPKFKIIAEAPPTDTSLILEVSCYNEYDELLTLPIRRRVRLIHKPPLPSKPSEVFMIVPWAWDVLARWPLPLRAVAVTALLFGFSLAGYFWLSARIPPQTRTDLARTYENLKRRYWYGHDTYLEPPWKDDFYLTDNPPKRWRYDEGQVQIVKGEGRAATDGALQVLAGPNMIVPNNLGSRAFYDYKVHFKLKFVDGTKAAWVFRSQADNRTGYVFVLEKSGNGLALSGRRYTGAGEYNDIDGEGPRRIEMGDTCCFPQDYFEVWAEIKGYTFTHEISISNYDPEARVKRTVITMGPYPLVPPFVDGDAGKGFRSGNAGFVKPDDSKMQVEFWYLEPDPLP